MATISPPQIVEDCHGIIKLYSDGTIFRSKDLNLTFLPVHDDGSVLWKDCLFHETHDLHLRLYKPAAAATSSSSYSSASPKLPVVYFFHGGGFCLGSMITWPNFHNCCMRLCSGLQALVVAPDYRLAPEHRLPAAYEDSLSALKWLQSRASLNNIDDDWLGVDFDRVYIMGDSSGGNIAHHLAVQLGPGSPELAPVRVRGYVLMAPFFGGTVRTKSEVEGPPEPLLTLDLLDCFWRLSLPIGENTDHPVANPFGPLSPNLESVKLDPLLVIVGGGELMRDRVEEYASRLKKLGKSVHYVEFAGKPHAFFTNDPYSPVSLDVLQQIQNFITQTSV